MALTRVVRRLGALGGGSRSRSRAEHEDDCGRCLTLAVPHLSSEYFGELADAVVREAGEHGWEVLVRQTGGERDAELDVLAHAGHGPSRGLILQPLGLGPEDAHVLAVAHPLVVLGERIFEGPVDHVTMPNAEAAETATRHLVSAGRRRIAAVGPNASDTSVTAAVLRADGYRAALSGAGIPYDPALVTDVRDWTPADGAGAVERLLRAGTPFDAVFAFADSLAHGVLSALARHGLRVPQDVAVVGFDDVRSARYTIPALTTVDAGTRAVAHSAVSLLDQRIRDGHDGVPRRFTTSHRLVQRESA